MFTTTLLLALVVGAATAYFVVPYLVRAFFRYKGTRVITCPETKMQALVEIDARHAALTSIVTKADIRLESCSRWPLRQECGQECLASIEGLPPDCLVQGVLMKWYRDKNCVYCGRKFEQVHWTDHKPALQSHDGKLIDWSEVRMSELEQTLSSNLPVCWDCYIAQSFRLEHPELVVYRPWVQGRSQEPNRH
jgi:hypothetical protein